MREVQVIIWCDACHAAGRTDVTGGARLVTLGDLGPLSLDLCLEHDQALLQPVRALLVDYGTPPELADPEPVQRRPAGKRTCPVCGKTLRILGAHMLNRHGLTLESTRGEDGLLHCPACSFTAVSGQALGNHARAAHDAIVGELLAAQLSSVGTQRAGSTSNGRTPVPSP